MTGAGAREGPWGNTVGKHPSPIRLSDSVEEVALAD